jgi:hypothetical protein
MLVDDDWEAVDESVKFAGARWCRAFFAPGNRKSVGQFEMPKHRNLGRPSATR